MSADRDREMPLLGHLDELRRRLTITAVAVGIATAASFVFAEHIVRLLLVPAGVQKCIALGPTENFATFMRVSLFAGVAIAMPVLLYQLYRYIDPALRTNERRFALVGGPFALVLFLAGMAFCYFVLLPAALGFLVNIGAAVIENQLRCAEYLSFVTMFILAIGLVFEMPAIIYGLVRLGILRRSWLAKQRRYAFLGAFVVGALITPTPDPFNQTLVAVPMYLLFELGLLLSRFGAPRAGG